MENINTWSRDDTELPGESGGTLGSLLVPLTLDIAIGFSSADSKNTRSCSDTKPSDDIICTW